MPTAISTASGSADFEAQGRIAGAAQPARMSGYSVVYRMARRACITDKELLMKYVCQICGHVYDEDVEGVKWEDLPEDWVCPLCGVDKSNFEPEA